MDKFSCAHFVDQDLDLELDDYMGRDRTTTPALLARIAEYEARGLYRAKGFDSMLAYCLDKFHLCEQATLKRIRAARTARRFPAIFEALDDGRLHMTAVIVLTPHLTSENAAELLNAAARKSRSQIEEILAAWFPRLELTTPVHAVSTPRTAEMSLGTVGLAADGEVSPRTVELAANGEVSPGTLGLAPSDKVSPGTMEQRSTRQIAPRPVPLSAERFSLELTMDRATRDKLQHIQDLLSHAVPSGDVNEVFVRALDALEAQLEKRKFGRTERPRAMRGSANPRHIPAAVRRAVAERDGGRCTFVSETGHRCAATRLLEFDHVEEVARGGRPSVDGLRLRCRTHNQFAAERTFGAEFMARKRTET